ncbi:MULTISPECIES: FAD-dependent monooxygenase [Alteromonas]|uniref:2-octaprenylphenol hydroxylase n=3 Tax=Alteromonas stellipolaris TaxID=233316 RepID=A0AAW7Z4Q4_9ALTE|nr:MULTISPECIES: FAD-dependent monooxygenase [Alteromonas]AMJ91644.1 2-octaprenylphenol hydroxylase [Alteromonas sp. Mac2]ALM89523.1 2-octaprenyl-3-methyl-6-methoxy-1,4-benzoquinol hydroxylase [Alteromonas stellipolaris LMG 21856]AMJ75358.1 2-octaprenylphenol hydroxylase [Alteromonas stellipolaris]AMJ87780.1 2-octaprenylphenol hydroxylase [Alteromonas sp. Mac1]MDO6578388.1 FAD-dependent monooxygenase [Alteromonas stellipolaris]
MQHVDIAIVGGGIVGLTLAAALKDAPCRIAIINKGAIDQPLGDKPGARVSAINQANINALKKADVWQHIDESRANPYNAMHVWDKDSFGDIHFAGNDTGGELESDTLGVIIENQALINGLAHSVLKQDNVVVIDTTIERVLSSPQQNMLMLENGDALSCRLLVGADGANSFVRKHANFPITFRDYEHTAIVANIRTQQPHENVARQAFTPTGPLALLPMRDPNVCSIVWSQTPDAAKTLQGYSDSEFCNALLAASNNALGPVTLETARTAFPLTMRYAREWAKEGIVLVGDAAHTIHPLAGQGANLGMQDALALAATLITLLDDQKDIGQLRYLRPYERARKTEAMKMIAAMDGFKFLFDGDDPLKKLIRGLGLAATDKLSAVKQAFVSHAMGL